MTKNTKVNAAILIIGNEILSGRTQDTNTSTIALWLNSIGVRVNEVRIIPDIESVIVKTINKLRVNNDYVFTTGGIGPTHDDITAESISKAFNLNYEIHKEDNGSWNKVNPALFFYNDLSVEEYNQLIELASRRNQSFD